MQKKQFEEFKTWINNNEVEAWEELQSLRQRFEDSYQEYFLGLNLITHEQAIQEAISLVKATLSLLQNLLDLRDIEPGHGLGHLNRDYVHSLLLSMDSDIDPGHLYVGLVAGSLHDVLGCSLIPRYLEQGRVIRHAEAGALCFLHLADDLGLYGVEADLIAYSVAAHTHYLRASTVKCSDDVEREILPYKDLDEEGEPIMSVFLTRWADRLDANGPAYVGRHYITLIEAHHDNTSEGGTYLVSFKNQMRPLLRSNEDIKADPKGRTMREHLAMYANSQNNESPYGRYDSGEMLVLRESYKKVLFRIIDAFDFSLSLSEEEERELLSIWTRWLYEKISPTVLGKKVAFDLEKSFLLLPEETRAAWHSVMRLTLEEYKGWSEKLKKSLVDFNQDQISLPVLGNVRNMI